jgi:predicted dehydrogenase
MSKPSTLPSQKTTRRSFIKKAGVVAAGSTALGLSLQRSVHAAGTKEIRFGLIGCGGRGSGAAGNAMNGGKDVKLVAMADWFEPKALGARERLKKIYKDQVAVADDHIFSGFDGYKKVMESDIDAVLIACSSHFQAPYLKAGIDAGKHVFVEKPHSLDAPGLRIVQEACDDAKKKDLNVVSGLCWRYSPVVRETIKRIRDGQIGDIVNAQVQYLASPYRVIERDPKWSELEWQMHNWYHFFWLAGDQCLQQLIHVVDRASFAFGDLKPESAWGVGGRAACSGAKYGDLFDHQCVVFNYKGGKQLTGISRNQVGTWGSESDTIFGTKGRASLKKGTIAGENNWRYKGEKKSMYDVEQAELFDAIRTGKTINNCEYMVNSTTMMIMATYAIWTGKRLTWDQVWNSKTTVLQPAYNWDMKPPVMPNEAGEYDIPIPGITKVV